MGWFTRILSTSVQDPEHDELRRDLWIGGSDHVCLYYLGMLIRRDFSVLPTVGAAFEAMRDDLQQYLSENASPAIVAFTHEGNSHLCYFAIPFLRQKFDRTFGTKHKFDKQDRGLILLLEHPDWSDEDIRLAVNTTEKQMQRWSTFKYARAIQRRYVPNQQ